MLCSKLMTTFLDLSFFFLSTPSVVARESTMTSMFFFESTRDEDAADVRVVEFPVGVKEVLPLGFFWEVELDELDEGDGEVSLRFAVVERTEPRPSNRWERLPDDISMGEAGPDECVGLVSAGEEQ